jgi:hypothetical protein
VEAGFWKDHAQTNNLEHDPFQLKWIVVQARNAPAALALPVFFVAGHRYRNFV